MADLFITEIDGYGDLQLNGNDLMRADGYESVPFLALFGDPGDWFGNVLMEGSQKFVSKTETMLKSVTLNSAGRLKIEQAIKEDLKFINENVPGTVQDITVTLVSDDRLDIRIIIAGREWWYNWNPKQGDKLPKGRQPVNKGIFTKQFTEQFV